MAEGKNPFFKVEDLEHLELAIVGMNSTSQVRFKENSIRLTQILDNGICIEVPPRSCAMGHSLALDISGKNLDEPIHIIGVIEEMHGEPNPEVRIKFRQYSQENWGQLLDYFAGKQTNINAIIKNTRK